MAALVLPGLCRPPPDTPLPKTLVEVGEGGGSEVVVVVGETFLSKSVALQRRHSGPAQHFGWIRDRAAHEAERVRPLFVDVSGEKHANLAADVGHSPSAGFPGGHHHGRICSTLVGDEQPLHGPLHPCGQGLAYSVGQRLRVLLHPAILSDTPTPV